MPAKILLVSITLGPMTEELGTCMIASFLRNHNHDVQVLSFGTDKLIVNCLQQIIGVSPDIIGFNIYDATRKNVYDLCRQVKKSLPSAMIFVGGVEAFCNPEKILKEENSIDFVVYGEGEITTLELLKTWIEGGSYQAIDGLAYRRKNSVVVNNRRTLMENISQLPLPSRDILKQNKIKVVSISTSRGCIGNCSFCVTPAMWSCDKEKRWRGLTIDKIICNVRELSKMGVMHIFINDCSYEDNNKERMLTVAKKIIEDGINIYYSVDFKPSVYRKLSDDDVKLLKKSGLINVFIGIESGNEKDIRLYNKGASVDDNRNVLRFFDAHNINQHFGFINFNPYSTFTTLRENAVFLKENQQFSLGNVLNHATALMLFEKTALYDKVVADGLLSNESDGIFKYRFLDSNVKTLAEFMIVEFFRIKREFGAAVMHDLGDRYIDNLSILQNEFSLNEKYADLLPFIVEAKKKARVAILENFHHHDYFFDLIDLAENGWSKLEAQKIIEKYFNKACWQLAIDNVKKARILLYKKILTRDYALSNLLNRLA